MSDERGSVGGPRRREPWRVVVAGGGFAGLYAAAHLASAFDLEPEDEVLLLDARNHFTFTPLLPEVAAGSMGREHVAVPFRHLALKHGFRFLQTRVEGLDPDACRIHTSEGPIGYDHCILALGSRPQYFGNEELERVAYPMKWLEDAVRLRDRVIGLCERSEAVRSPERRRELLTFVVAGGGPAGVETASELHHLLHGILPRYYDCAPLGRVLLVEGGDRILRGFDEGLARQGERTLRERGLDLRLGTLVEDADAERVVLGGGEEIRTPTLIWTAGVAPHPIAGASGLSVERGAAIVDESLRAVDHENLWVAGDLSHATNPRTGSPYPAVAPIAISQGVRAAGNVENDRAGRSAEPYRAHHAGSLVSLGAGEALLEMLGLRISGTPAWLLYRLTYLAKLVGLRNKAQVAFTLTLNSVFERDLSTDWTPPGDRAA